MRTHSLEIDITNITKSTVCMGVHVGRCGLGKGGQIQGFGIWQGVGMVLPCRDECILAILYELWLKAQR